MKGAPAIGFAYRGSRLLLAATLVMAVLAVIAVWRSALSYWLCLVLTAVIFAWAAMAGARLLQSRIRRVWWRSDGGIDLDLCGRGPSGDTRVAGILSAGRLMGPLVVLSVRWPPRQRASLWLLPDNLDQETRRHLRMRLATAGTVPVSESADSA